MSYQSIPEIERALERDREALARSLAALRDRMRPASILSHGAASLKSGAAAVVARASEGLARGADWLTGQDGQASPTLAGTRYEALSRWEDEGGPPAPDAEPLPFEPEEDWLVEARDLRARALALLARIDDAARTGLAPPADLARHRAEIVAAFAAETAIALGRGLESLGEAARSAALEARERTYLARVAVAQPARAEVEAQPLVAVALAAAAGATLACLLPRTEAEDRLLGTARDRLAGDLKRLARPERLLAGDLAPGLSAAFGRGLDRAEAAAAAPDGQTGSDARHALHRH
ncbi:hypothetical protein [Rhodobacter calidifons]|uniref:Uncharacterized protein n=1 Tax=Rhodobacter calidifons TaxID=2715277 RepID=A0ABX0G564_9RHOB|nr:hypothetical protein [Rhodobacter calidifons]NHB76008.1 hypothetical protein [Rhodobacter calidifons]